MSGVWDDDLDKWVDDFDAYTDPPGSHPSGSTSGAGGGGVSWEATYGPVDRYPSAATRAGEVPLLFAAAGGALAATAAGLLVLVLGGVLIAVVVGVVVLLGAATLVSTYLRGGAR